MVTHSLTVENVTRAEEPAPRGANGSVALIAQPERSPLPIRIPVLVQCAGANLKAEVIGSTDHVLLLQGTEPGVALPPLGSPVRLRVEWDRQLLVGRLAAHGVAGRFLVSMGERAIRYSRRFAVDLPGVATNAHLAAQVEVRIVDLSTGGARITGIDLPVGTEVELWFAPPGQPAPLNVLGFVVRAIDGAPLPTLGVAFRLVQPSMDLLGREGHRST